MKYRNKKNRGLYVILILTILFGVSVGYAAISRVLSINGSSEVRQNTWDLHFDNVVVTSGSVETDTAPTINNTALSVNFNFFLKLPGEFYEFTVEVHNDGSIDAMIDSITKTPELTDEQNKYMNYIIEYQNGEQITSNQLIKKDEFVRIKVRVEYRTDITENDLPTASQSFDLGFTLNYVQADSTAVNVKDNGTWIAKANGLLDEIGTIVTIGSEQFYTIGTEGENVKLLSMYNLYVGGEYNKDSDVWTAYGKEATGKQNDDMKGYISGGLIRKGTTAFSSDEQKGTNYSDYNGSIVEKYANNYKIILEKDYGVDVVEARLITKEEIEYLGCNSSNNSCSSAPRWVYSTSFWLSSAFSSGTIWYVYSYGAFDHHGFDYNAYFGCRPVIVMKKSDIVVDVKPVADGSLDDIGTIVTIGDQQFYTMGTEGDNVKLFAMYNLYVGNSIVDWELSTLANPTGKQSELAKGYSSTSSGNSIGTTAFSSDEQKGTNYSDYNGSIVEGYVNNYKTILEEYYKIDVIEARLITYDELTDSKTFACVEQDSCSNKYPWIYSTSYWTNTAINTGAVWCINSPGILSFDPIYGYSNQNNFGVRPVIVIPKSLF